jgi:formylmethanofuran dehydrogenase subunit E
MRLSLTVRRATSLWVEYTAYRQSSSMGLGSIRQEGNVEDEEELSQCTRCEDMVVTETLVRLADWSVCEICWGDI